jgi:hypothetical protein
MPLAPPLSLIALAVVLLLLTWLLSVQASPPPAAPDAEPAGPDLPDLRHQLRVEGHIQRPFYDPNSAPDRRLTTYGDEAPLPLEVDTPAGLARTQELPFSGGADFVVYQNWGQTIRGPAGQLGRSYQWLTEERAQELARMLRGGSTTKLWLVVTMFGPGSLRAFADALGPGQIEMLGLLWYFSGDDFTDELENAEDVAHVVRTLDLRRLSILTSAWDDRCEARLAEALAGHEALEFLGVFEKDDEATWPRYATPSLDALCRG